MRLEEFGFVGWVNNLLVKAIKNSHLFYSALSSHGLKVKIHHTFRIVAEILKEFLSQKIPWIIKWKIEVCKKVWSIFA